MLAIRMQRTGRHGHAMFRMIVQDSRRTPTSGNIVALLGNYDPHTKTATFDKDKASYYLEHGAQPSDRVAFLLKSQGVKLPSWVVIDNKKTATIRHQAKLRRNRPAEAAPVAEVIDEVVPEAEPTAAEAEASDSPEVAVALTPEETTEPVVEEAVSTEPAIEKPEVDEPTPTEADPSTTEVALEK